MTLPNQYARPTTYTTTVTSEDGGQIRFNSANVRDDALAATDVSVYVEALVEAAEEYLNGPEWREEAEERTPCEFRPAGSEPTGQQVITMADRTVTFNPRHNWDGRQVEKDEVLAGSVIFTEATEKALVISHRATILDHNIQAGFTAGSMQQTADKMLRDIELSAAGRIAQILSGSKSTEKFSETKLSGKPVEQAEDLVDYLTVHINQSVGHTLNDFVILLPVGLLATLERAAQRSGFTDIEDMIGATVQPYGGTDYGVFLLPRHFTSLSYRERSTGDVWSIIATRNPAVQGYDLEIMAVVDVLAEGMVKVALTEDKLQTERVAFPMVTNITFDKAEPVKASKAAAK